MPPAAHSHPWSDLSGVPTAFPPSAHQHAIGDVSGLQGALRHVKAYAPPSMSLKGDQKVWKKLEALAGQLHRQQQTRSALKDRLRSVAYACSTRKALLAALPEFEKYLPEDEPAALRTLPVVANVVADFVKAGWPKAAAPRQASAAT